MKRRKLTRSQFADALALGLGSALLHVKAHGDAGLEDLIAEALYKNNVYDLQVEGTKSYWLANLVDATRNPDFYVLGLLKRLKAEDLSTAEISEYDLVQHVRLGRCFFECGYAQFRTVIFARFKALVDNNGFHLSCGYELVEVAGQAGLIFVARTLGAAKEPPDIDFCFSIWKEALEELGGDLVENFARLEKEDPLIKIFMEAAREGGVCREEPVTKPERKQKSLTELFKMIETKVGSEEQYAYPMLGRNMPEKDRAEIFKALLDTTDPWAQSAYFKLLSAKPLPYVNAKLLALLDSADNRLTHAAAYAMSSTTSSAVREKALEMLGSDNSFLISKGFKLLENNFVLSDLAFLLVRIKMITGASHWLHSAGMSIRKMFEQNKSGAFSEILLWLYNNGPDSFCRRTFLSHLLQLQSCPEDLLFEAQWDLNDEIQMLARSTLSAQSFAHLEASD